MKHFKEIPVPKVIEENCDKDKRGLYVPFIVLKEGDVHHFKINDHNKVAVCVHTKCCSVCGTELKDDSWFIGGPASVFHKRGAIADLPVHKSCGEYSLQVCPYLAYGRYTSKTDLEKLYERLENKTLMLVNTTIDNDRVPLFCFVKSNDYEVKHSYTTLFKTKIPYQEIEFWYDGEQLSQETGEKILKEHFEDKYTLEDLDYTLKENHESSTAS